MHGCMRMDEALDLIRRHVRDPAHGWSIGMPGAIGEFLYDAGERADIQSHGADLSVCTPRGAMRLHIPETTRCIAYESLSRCSQGWSQAVAFCVPAAHGASRPRAVVTELGGDSGAVDAAARDAVLFDLGLGSPVVEFCVRTGDGQLLSALRAGAGRGLFDASNPALPALTAASPVRVIRSRLGRIEIYQGIPGNGGRSPRGPHTHLLPPLLGSEVRDGPAVPEGWVCALTLHPRHPLFDKYGESHGFDRSAYQAFQDLLRRYGSAEYCAAKARVRDLMRRDAPPAAAGSPLTKLAQRVVRAQRGYLN